MGYPMAQNSIDKLPANSTVRVYDVFADSVNKLVMSNPS